ncbi:MAG: LLM class flavin-dependent oxidoreductase [Acidobacteria bacterium]|nr:LLM class flavin-dependent oxidoreductase [Acidobacteriota bacterium]
MRYGFWLPVFGGWLRNIDDEQMPATWEYVRDLALQAEALGYDLTLIAELNLNDIKGPEADSLDAWSTAAALASVTRKLELMVAVRPTFHSPALLAKQAANIDRISGGRLTLNVVSSWWADEARKYGIPFDEHDDRYARTSEWLDVLDACWHHQHTSHHGRFYNIEDNILSPKPFPRRTYSGAHPNQTPSSRPEPQRSEAAVERPAGSLAPGAPSQDANSATNLSVLDPSSLIPSRPTLYAGGESETAKNLIAAKCDAYLMHGDDPNTIAAKIADMRARRAHHPHLPPMTFGVTGYCILRDSEAEAQRELTRITSAPDPSQSPAGFANFQQWITGSQLEKKLSLRDYSVSNRGLHSGLIGTPETIAQRLADFEGAGCSLVLLQSSPQHTEMARFAAQVMRSS